MKYGWKTLRKIEEIKTKQFMVEKTVSSLKEQVEFITQANRHDITVERVSMVPDPDPDTDEWGWSGPPEKMHREVRHYSIDKEILLTALRKNIEEQEKLIAQFQKEFEEL